MEKCTPGIDGGNHRKKHAKDHSKDYLRPDQIDDHCKMRLRKVGLRPTRQRLMIAAILLNGPHRHISAEQLRDEVVASGQYMALATIYNCLHQFESAGLLRHVDAGGGAVLYDTNLSEHYHFLDVDTGQLIDINPEQVSFSSLPELPSGFETLGLEVIVRMRRKS